MGSHLHDLSEDSTGHAAHFSPSVSWGDACDPEGWTATMLRDTHPGALRKHGSGSLAASLSLQL